MTSDDVADGWGATGGAEFDQRAPAVAELLDSCDRILGELGRRQHLFAWLRPADQLEGWLAVDAYYPSNRIVVVCRSESAPHDHLYGELVPEHGLRLLELRPGELSNERSEARETLRRLIDELGPAPERAREAPLPEQRGRETPLSEVAFARVAAALTPTPPPAIPVRRTGPSQAAAAQRAARFVAARKSATPAAADRRATPVRRSPPVRARHRPAPRPAGHARHAESVHPNDFQPLGVLIGLALAAIVLAEVYLGVIRIGLDRGHVLLAFGLALDACARSLGTVAARRARRSDWSWLCALGGSPLVAAFALFRRDGPVRVDPAPLAGLISLLAVGVLLVALIAAALGA